MSMSDTEKLNWLRLIRTSGIGPISFFELLRRHNGDASAAISALPGLSKLSRRKTRLKPISMDEAKRELDATRRYGGEILCVKESDYPPMLKTLDVPPPLLTMLGDKSLFSSPCIAMVGARNASASGLEIAGQIANGLGQAGYVIASGLARGIDARAHLATLESGTIAVIAGGIDHIYPNEHEALYGQIRENGVIVSESPFGYRAVGRDFPRRNRLITGLAAGVVVVEATRRSGSLISARTALEQHREVMAVPGSPLEPRSAGTNNLIKSGAALVENAEDIIDLFDTCKGREGVGDMDREFAFETDIVDIAVSEDMRQKVLGLLGVTPIHIDKIIRSAGISAREAICIVAELELSGEAISGAGGMVARANGQ